MIIAASIGLTLGLVVVLWSAARSRARRLVEPQRLPLPPPPKPRSSTSDRVRRIPERIEKNQRGRK